MKHNLILALGLSGMIALPVLAQSETTKTTKTTITKTKTDTPIHVEVNQKQVTFVHGGPVMIGGHSVEVPLRGVFEQMGGQVQWDSKARTITGARPGHQFQLHIGSNQALVDGTQTTLNTPPQVINGTAYVPLRFAGEALGADVAWEPASNTVIITDKPDSGTTKTVIKKVIKKTTTTTDPGSSDSDNP